MAALPSRLQAAVVASASRFVRALTPNALSAFLIASVVDWEQSGVLGSSTLTFRSVNSRLRRRYSAESDSNVLQAAVWVSTAALWASTRRYCSIPNTQAVTRTAAPTAIRMGLSGRGRAASLSPSRSQSETGGFPPSALSSGSSSGSLESQSPQPPSASSLGSSSSGWSDSLFVSGSPESQSSQPPASSLESSSSDRSSVPSDSPSSDAALSVASDS